MVSVDSVNFVSLTNTSEKQFFIYFGCNVVDEDSFYPLRDLLDYCQVALVLPCYAAQMWIKTEMGPPEIAIIHAGLGLVFCLTKCQLFNWRFNRNSSRSFLYYSGMQKTGPYRFSPI